MRIVPVTHRTSLLMLGGAFALAAQPVPADSSLTFGGRVLAGTCDVHADDAAKSVPLPTLRADELSSFNEAPIPASETPFQLRLINCRGVTKAHLDFSGTPAGSGSAQYANTGSASGVAVHLVEASNGKVINASGHRITLVIDGETTKTFDAKAYYYRLGTQDLKQGLVDTTAIVTVQYD